MFSTKGTLWNLLEHFRQGTKTNHEDPGWQDWLHPRRFNQLEPVMSGAG